MSLFPVFQHFREIESLQSNEYFEHTNYSTTKQNIEYRGTAKHFY